MTNEIYRICISSPPDREKVVAEIFFGPNQWAEINQEQAGLQIEYYQRPDGKPWTMDFEIAASVMIDAKQALVDAQAGHTTFPIV